MKTLKDILEGIVSQGRIMGARSGTSYRKVSSSGDHDHTHGLKVGASRNYGQEKFVVNRDKEEKERREKIVQTRRKESEARMNKLSKMAKDMSEDTNTEKREKIKSVARPDDPKPTESGLLYKQAQIKNKIIDEDKPMSLNFGLSKDLIAATRAVMEKKDEDDVKIGKGKTEVDLKPKTDDDINDDGSEKMDKKCPVCKKSPCKCESMKEEKCPKCMKSPCKCGAMKEEEKELSSKQKKIARMAGDPNKIDAEDFKALRAGKRVKEEVEELDELSTGTRAAYRAKASEHARGLRKQLGVIGQIKSDDEDMKSTVDSVKKDIKRKLNNRITGMLRSTQKEEVEELDEISKKTLGSYIKKASDDAARHAYMSGKKDGDLEHAAKTTKRYRGIIKATERLTKEELEEAKADYQLWPNQKKKTFYQAPKDKHGKTDIQKWAENKAKEKMKIKMKEEIDALTEEQLEEILKKSDPASKWISDFVHSKDPKFAGKSKKERMKQALGAYYAKQRNEEVTFSQSELDRIEEIAKQLGE